MRCGVLVSAAARPTPASRSTRATPRRAFREDKATGEPPRTQSVTETAFKPIREAEVDHS